MRNLLTYFLLFPAILLVACHKERDRADFIRLKQLDSLIAVTPEAVPDSLERLDASTLSGYNRGYYDLLQVIAQDKTYHTFTSDSLINAAEKMLAKSAGRYSAAYARALMYQGVVRYRMGITDSTAYRPIRKAAELFERLSPPDSKNTYLSNYYLGSIHEENNNISLSENYFGKALAQAKQLKDSAYLFVSYRNLFWSRMQLPDYPRALLYLDTISRFRVKDLPGLIDLENMRTVYFQKTSDYAKALEAQKNLLDLKRVNARLISLSDLYNLSIIYKKLGIADSAYRYGKMTVQAISDSSARLNYLYYKNLAEIADNMNRWEESARAYSETYRLMDKAMDKNRDTRILELEKKYDKAEIENKALQLKNRNTVLGFMLALALLLGILFIFRQKVRKQLVEERNTVLEKEKLLSDERQMRMEEEKNRAERQLNENRLILSFFHHISRQNLEIKHLLYDLSIHSTVEKDTLLHEKITEHYDSYNKEATILDVPFLPDEQLHQILGLSETEAAKLNRSDKIIILLTYMQANSSEIALLFQTTPVSIRNRKSKLKKKIARENIQFSTEISLLFP